VPTVPPFGTGRNALIATIGKAFYSHGTTVARHWFLSLLISIAVGVALCYPALFLYYDNPSTGSSNLPHHVWTSARTYVGNPDTPHDIEMRQIWIYGSYMKVIEPDVVSKATEIQNYVLGTGSQQDAAHGEGAVQEGTNLVPNGIGSPDVDYGESNNSLGCKEAQAGELTWGYHSPLIYWNCSKHAAESDPDLLSTINSQANRRSQLNLTMRPTSVFAGKTFVGNNLTAADALVITFFNNPALEIGRIWEKRMQDLAEKAPDRWWLYPSNGTLVRNKLYEFRFQPVSFNDDFALGVAYAMMALYVMFSLRKIRAVKSTFGLILTVLVQVCRHKEDHVLC
jgi:hypothetical protein